MLLDRIVWGYLCCLALMACDDGLQYAYVGNQKLADGAFHVLFDVAEDREQLALVIAEPRKDPRLSIVRYGGDSCEVDASGWVRAYRALPQQGWAFTLGEQEDPADPAQGYHMQVLDSSCETLTKPMSGVSEVHSLRPGQWVENLDDDRARGLAFTRVEDTLLYFDPVADRLHSLARPGAQLLGSPPGPPSLWMLEDGELVRRSLPGGGVVQRLGPAVERVYLARTPPEDIEPSPHQLPYLIYQSEGGIHFASVQSLRSLDRYAHQTLVEDGCALWRDASHSEVFWFYSPCDSRRLTRFRVHGGDLTHFEEGVTYYQPRSGYGLLYYELGMDPPKPFLQFDGGEPIALDALLSEEIRRVPGGVMALTKDGRFGRVGVDGSFLTFQSEVAKIVLLARHALVLKGDEGQRELVALDGYSGAVSARFSDLPGGIEVLMDMASGAQDLESVVLVHDATQDRATLSSFNDSTGATRVIDQRVRLTDGHLDFSNLRVYAPHLRGSSLAVPRDNWLAVAYLRAGKERQLVTVLLPDGAPIEIDRDVSSFSPSAPLPRPGVLYSVDSDDEREGLWFAPQ